MTDTLDTCAQPGAPTVALPAIAPSTVPPGLAAAAVAGGALLVDVRSAPTRSRQGAVPGALIGDRTRLDAQFGLDSADRLPGVDGHDRPVVVLCGSEQGSRPVAEALLAQGFASVVHVAGGFPSWAAAGLPAGTGTDTP